jgi:hypothetical protein
VTTSQAVMMSAMLAMLGGPPLAHATVGGPTTIDVLGWSPTDQKVYLQEIRHDEGDGFGRVLTMALDAPSDAPPVEVPWTASLSREGSASDPEANRRLAALRDRLRPLPPRECPAFPWSLAVTGRDTLHATMGDYPRFRLLARFQVGDGFELSTLHQPLVVLRDVRDIPGRRELLVVLAYVGIPDEGGYELQVPLIVRPDEVGPRPVGPRGNE